MAESSCAVICNLIITHSYITHTSYLLHKRVLYLPLTAALHESEVHCILKIQGRFNREAGKTRLDTAILLDLTPVNTCVSTKLENIANQTGKQLADVVERKKKV